jgi:hypothetical protein
MGDNTPLPSAAREVAARPVVPSKKRPSPGSSSVQQQQQPGGAHSLKQARGPLPHATACVPAAMTPPQLRGRSNSATVDLAGLGLNRAAPKRNGAG